MRSRCALLAAFLIVAAVSLTGSASIQLRVTPREAQAPADVFVCVVLERDPANRLLQVEVEGDDFFTASSAVLDGEGARRVNDFMFRRLPPGEYDVRASVFDGAGRQLGSATRNVTIR
ncbi:MAG TPA: hypothetical protein VFA27_02475 [Vicinamibacterales bacterium]|nr:hypothetical protein [Vicinamibacterales bacterium]